MKFTQKEYGSPIEILKYNDFKGAPCMVDEHTAEEVTGSGESAKTTPAYKTEGDRKIIKAGTPYPKNDATCKGIILHDVDITDGEAPATYVFAGSIDTKKVTKNGITIATAVKTALPRITFFD